MAINVPLQGQLQNTSQLTQQVQNALNAVRINLGGAGGARSLSALSQPLGRLTGQADEFTKSLDAANARVLAFGASVGVVNAVSNAFKALVNSTIEVEKAITAISVVGDQFNGKAKELSQGLFNIAKTTGQSFGEVSKAALEFSRQGLNLEETLARTNDALVLTRTTGLESAKSVDGLTAAVNAFAKAGLSTTQVLNKLAAVDQAFAVSSADLIEAFQRTGAVAQQAGVSFDELAGIVTALQTETSRGGAVIGNALKTIFSRLQDTSTLTQLQDLGVAVQDLQGNLLPARQILQNLAGDVQGLSKVTQAGVFKDVAGTFQLNQLVSLVNDLNKAQSISAAATQKSAGATNEAYIANEKLNQSLDAIFNKLSTTGKQLGSLLGEIGLSDNIKGLLDGISSFLESVNNILQGDDIGSKFAKGFVKGIGAVLSGPGLGIFLAIIVKLSYDLLKFGAQSLKTFLNIGRAASDQKQIQESIVQTLLKNENLLNSILSTQGGQNAQALKFLGILNQQASAMQLIQGLAGNIASTAYSSGYRPTAQGLQRKAAGGYLPAQEASDVKRGVGGASPSSKVVAIPNFAFGGGQRGTMIANTSEYIVPNYAGGGSAIFNQDMVKTMGLPAGAKKISAAGGFIPNFAIRGLASNESVLAGRIFEALIRNDKYIDLTENEVKPDIPEGYSYGEAEAKMSVQAALRDKNFGPNRNKKNVVIVPKDSSKQYDKELIEKKGSTIIRPKEDKLSRANIFPIARKILARESLKKESSYSKIPINASNGYIPNFANYIFDRDKIPSGLSGTILNSILASSKRKDLIVGPAGSGKSTVAAGLGTFIKTLDDLNKATSFTVLSSSGLSSKGGLTEPFQNILSAVNRSGGKTTYLATANEELKKRRASRTLSGGDVRSAGELSGALYAPLNQRSFIKQLKKESSNFELMRQKNTSGFKNSDLAVLGLYGQKGSVNGSSVYTLNSERPDLTKDIKKEYEVRVKSFVRSYSQELANKIGIKRSPKEVKKAIQQSSSVSGFIFEDVLNQLSGGFNTASLSGGSRIDFQMTPNLKTVFGTGGEKYAEAKLNPYSSDAVQSIIEKQNALASGRASLPQKTSNVQSIKAQWFAYQNRKNKREGFEDFNSIARSLNINPTVGSKSSITDKINAALKSAATGYVPNFAAAALQQAIAREKSAGLSDSQIYVDQNPSLKSSLNPMGLMVANTRDEPSGGIQGISRARKEGANPKTYGAANGFVPNYVNYGMGSAQRGQGVGAASSLNLSSPTTSSFDPNKIEAVNKGFGDTAGKIIILQSALAFLSSAVGEGESSIEKFTQRLVQSSGNITSLAFLGKEIGNINIEAKGMKGAFGNFTKGIGLAGVAVGIAVEGFNLLDFTAKELSGENQKAAFAAAKLADASDKLSLKFESLSKTRQAEISVSTEQVLGSAGFEGFLNSFANIFREKKVGGGDIGGDSEVKKAIASLYTLGASTEQVLGVLKSVQKYSFEEKLSSYGIGKSYEKKDTTQVSDVIAALEEAISSGFGKVLSDQFRLFETELSKIDLVSPEQGQQAAAKAYGVSKFSEIPAGAQRVVNNRINQQIELNKQKKIEVDLEKELALGERINIDLAKQKLENMLEQKKAAIDINTYSGTSSLRFQLEVLDVSEKYKNSLEKQIKLKEIDGELSKKNLDIVKSAIDQLTSLPSGSSLGVNAMQFSGIKDVLKDSNIQTPEQFTNAINSIGNQLELNPAQLKNVNAFFVDQISNAKKLADAQKISTENTAAFNEKIIDTKNILESLSAVRKRELEYQAKYAEELRGLNDEEIIAAKKRQILEQRSGKRGFERGLDTIQDRINNYRVTLGEEIPNLFSSNLAQGLNDAISGAKDLKTALTDAATSFFQEITRKNISNLADMVTGGIGGIGGFFTKKASGGLISGGSGTKDDVPAMLMGGEYVLKKSAVSKYGKGFLDAINSGSMRGYATGGIVDPQTFPTQTGRGGFFTPGDYGQGAITGKNELLTFATQSNTGGQYDYMGGFGTGGATVSLEPESARLSSFGRENSPMFERVQQSKDEAFRVYLEGLQKEKEYADLLEQIAKDKKARKKALQTAIISAVATTALSYAGSAFSAGAKNATAASIAGGGKGGFLTSLKGGVSNLGNLFKPSKALGLSADTKFLQSIGVSSYKDLSSGKVSSEDSLKLFQKYPNLGKSYTFSGGAYRASGGLISGGSNIRDDVPAMLTGGEFVLNNRATQRIGTQNLHKLNSGAQIGGESSSAETTQALISKLDELIQTTANSSKENVVVNVSTSEADGQKQENPAGIEKELQKKIREAVLNVIAQEKRLGGSLEKSR